MSATLAWVHSRAVLPARVQAVLVDRSQRQLTLARDLVSSAAEGLPGLGVDISTLRTTIEPRQSAWRLMASGADLVVASHLLTENLEDAPFLVEMLNRSMAPNAKLLIVERPDDMVWSRLPQGEGATVCLADKGFPLNGFAGQRAERKLSARYLVVSAGQPALAGLVDRYFRAWRDQSVDELDNVFAADATYQDKPLERPIRTLGGIRDYWVRRVLPQEQPDPQILNLVLRDHCAFVEWQTGLTLKGKRKLVTGVMSMELDKSGERIGHLRECYSSKTLG
jgi:SAM-dependent methyltransferase